MGTCLCKGGYGGCSLLAIGSWLLTPDPRIGIYMSLLFNMTLGLIDMNFNDIVFLVSNNARVGLVDEHH